MSDRIKRTGSHRTYDVHGFPAVHIGERGDEERRDTTEEGIASGEVTGLLLRDLETDGDGPKGSGDEAGADCVTRSVYLHRGHGYTQAGTHTGR